MYCVQDNSVPINWQRGTLRSSLKPEKAYILVCAAAVAYFKENNHNLNHNRSLVHPSSQPH